MGLIITPNNKAGNLIISAITNNDNLINLEERRLTQTELLKCTDLDLLSKMCPPATLIGHQEIKSYTGNAELFTGNKIIIPTEYMYDKYLINV